MMEVTVESASKARPPRLLFELKWPARSDENQPQYDVSPDGKRLVMIRMEGNESPEEIRVVLDWFEELRRLVPGGR